MLAVILALIYPILCIGNLERIYIDPELLPLESPLAVIDKNLVSNNETTFRIARRLNFLGWLYTVENLATEKTDYTIFGLSPIHRQRFLMDRNDTVLCNVYSGLKVFKAQKLFLGRNTSNLISEFEQATNVKDYWLKLKVINLYTNQTVQVLMSGDAMMHKAAKIFMQTDKGLVQLATIQKFKTWRQSFAKRQYTVMIASGVDVAFVIMIAATFDTNIVYKLKD